MAYAQGMCCGDELWRVKPINGRAQAVYIQNTGEQKQHHTPSRFARPEMIMHRTNQGQRRCACYTHRLRVKCVLERTLRSLTSPTRATLKYVYWRCQRTFDNLLSRGFLWYPDIW